MSKQTEKWAGRFFSIWGVQILSLLGSTIAQFAIVWWLTDTTGSAVVLTTASLAALAPQVLLGPFIGSLVDRWDRRKVMIIADGVVAAFGLLLAILFWVDVVQIWHLYVIMILRSVAGTFHWPAMQASTSLMVPEEHLPRISGLNQMIQGASSIISPPLGALLLVVLPLHGMMMIDVITALIAITPLFFIAIPQPEPEETAQAGETSLLSQLWTDTCEGIGYFWNWKGLRQIVMIAAVLNFLWAPAFTLMPLLVRNYFGQGALELGYLEASWGVGIVIGGLLLAALGGGRRPVRTAVLLLAVEGLLLMLVPLAPPDALWMAALGLGTAALANSMLNGLFLGYLQGRVEPSKQGRVFTALQTLCGAMMPIGLAVAGPVSNLLGIRAWFFAAALGAALTGVLSLGSRHIRALDEPRSTGHVNVSLREQGSATDGLASVPSE